MFEIRVAETNQLIGNWNNSGKIDITQGIFNITGYDGEFYLWIGTNGNHTVIVEQNLDALPEFSSWTILVSGFLASIMASMAYRRRIKQGRKK